jgi:hypothetical protein
MSRREIHGDALGDRKIHGNLEYWRQFQVGDWIVQGFTERDSATFLNLKTDRTIRVTSDHIDLLAGHQPR